MTPSPEHTRRPGRADAVAPSRKNRDDVTWLDRLHQIGTDPFVAGADYDDVVVGAGLTGLVAAVLLARAGRPSWRTATRGRVPPATPRRKLSLLQGTTLSTLIRFNAENVAAAYLQGNREGLAWLLRYCSDHQIPAERRDAYTYAGTKAGVSAVRKELDIGRRLGLEVTWGAAEELPYAHYGAVRLADQAQLDPMVVLAALAAELGSRQGELVQGVRVDGVTARTRVTLSTQAGPVTAANVILATGVPFLDRGLYFAKVTPLRSYALAFTVPGDLPRGMYLTADSPTRSLRTAHHAGQELLLVGGNGHPVGRHRSTPCELVADLTAWTNRYFPGAEPSRVRSAQDYRFHDYLPFVGKVPRAGDHVYLATGYNKWGMTNAVAAALRICGEMLGGNMPWAETLATRVSKPVSAVREGQSRRRRGRDAGLAGRPVAPARPSHCRHPRRGKASSAACAVPPSQFPPSTAGPASSPRSAATSAAWSGSTTWRSPGTARSTAHGSPPTERDWRVRPPKSQAASRPGPRTPRAMRVAGFPVVRPQGAGRPPASRLRRVDEFVDVVVATPPSSRNVYEVDQQGQVRFDRRLLGSFAYPADYGYMVSATGSDGEPLDALALMPEPTYSGVRVRARVVGVFWIMTGHGREAKLVCVPDGDPAYRDVSDLTQLPEHQLREIALLRHLP
jgi:inorganic pyrophosphatase/glycine/D-amino acid oxidase-like deaminating enzyme